MRTFQRLEDFPVDLRGGVLSIGKFDGLHLGHEEILTRVVARARRLDAPSVVFTFDPTPAQVLRPESAPPALCDLAQKIELLERRRIDALFVLPTTREFLRSSAESFVKETVVGIFGAVALVEGQNFCFGRAKEGNDSTLAALCERYGLALEIAEPVDVDGAHVSSSAIRDALRQGEVVRAAQFLGRPYAVRGVVELGDQRGRTLGYPTANLGRTTTLLPKPALYAATARTYDGAVYPAAVNLGGNPTFGVDKIKIEAHLLDFRGDLYDRPMELTFLEKIRDVVRFASKEALLEQMRRDVEATRSIVQERARS